MGTKTTKQSMWDMNRLDELISELSRIRSEMLETENRFVHKTQSVVAAHCDSAKNLLHYLALRRRDIRPLQDKLASCGLSSLGRSESRVLANLDAVLKVVSHLACKEGLQPGLTDGDFAFGKSTLEKNTVALLGAKPAERDVRIMVTMPSAAASDYGLIRDLVRNGMDCMRVNCAHDDEDAWASMVEKLRRAERELDKECRVLMDVPGPKLRTGPTESVPGVTKWSPRRNRFGTVTERAKIWLTPLGHPESSPESADASLNLPADWLSRLCDRDTIKFLDARGLSRSMEVTRRVGSSRLAESAQTSYVTSDTILHVISGHGTSRKLTDTARLGELAPQAQPIILMPGDILILTKNLDRGKPAVRNGQGYVLEPATISVALPEIFSDVRIGEKIWFDDGKIGGVINSVDENEIRVEIVKARLKGEKLWADKGINLPDSELHLPALTQEDIARLSFIARHSDLVGYSFVRRASDVHLLQSELAKVGGRHLGIVLKIETRKAFERLPDLILAAMGSERIGVMIARGDLAVECGYERTGELQEEIMWIAEAAHIPVIWATQVLENLAKKGQPSRAEITDAAMAERAECVMLNKGPYVVDAVRVLDDVLRRMQSHQAKKSSLLRPLTLADRFCQGQATY
jgi:pyruvate kinase